MSSRIIRSTLIVVLALLPALASAGPPALPDFNKRAEQIAAALEARKKEAETLLERARIEAEELKRKADAEVARRQPGVEAELSRTAAEVQKIVDQTVQESIEILDKELVAVFKRASDDLNQYSVEQQKQMVEYITCAFKSDLTQVQRRAFLISEDPSLPNSAVIKSEGLFPEGSAYSKLKIKVSVKREAARDVIRAVGYDIESGKEVLDKRLVDMGLDVSCTRSYDFNGQRVSEMQAEKVIKAADTTQGKIMDKGSQAIDSIGHALENAASSVAK